jgi:N-acetylmuramoyl-L-alanine amidase
VETPDNKTPADTPEQPVLPEKINGISYKVQLKASSKKLLKSDKVYKAATNIQYEYVNGVYKYLSGPYTSFSEAGKFLKKARTLGYTDAFVAVYKNGKRLSLSEAKQYLK